LLARWDEGYEEVWLVVTDLAPEQATVVWYGMRSWIEGGFKGAPRHDVPYRWWSQRELKETFPGSTAYPASKEKGDSSMLVTRTESQGVVSLRYARPARHGES